MNIAILASIHFIPTCLIQNFINSISFVQINLDTSLSVIRCLQKLIQIHHLKCFFPPKRFTLPKRYQTFQFFSTGLDKENTLGSDVILEINKCSGLSPAKKSEESQMVKK